MAGLLWNGRRPYLFTVLIAPKHFILLLLTLTYVTTSSYKHAFDGLFRVVTEGWQLIPDANLVTEGMYFSCFEMPSCRGNSQPMERIITKCHQSNTDNHFSGVCKGRLKPFSFSHMWSTNVGCNVWASEASPDRIRVSFSSTLCTFNLTVTCVYVCRPVWPLIYWFAPVSQVLSRQHCHTLLFKHHSRECFDKHCWDLFSRWVPPPFLPHPRAGIHCHRYDSTCGRSENKDDERKTWRLQGLNHSTME